MLFVRRSSLGEIDFFRLSCFLLYRHRRRWLNYNIKISIFNTSTLKNILNKSSKLNLKTKLNIYDLVLKSIWTHGIQLWGSAKKSNANEVQIFQSKVLRLISNASPYMPSFTLHDDLSVPLVKDLVKQHYKKFHNRLLPHTYPLILNLSSVFIPGNPIRRLKRLWSRDLF